MSSLRTGPWESRWINNRASSRAGRVSSPGEVTQGGRMRRTEPVGSRAQRPARPGPAAAGKGARNQETLKDTSGGSAEESCSKAIMWAEGSRGRRCGCGLSGTVARWQQQPAPASRSSRAPSPDCESGSRQHQAVSSGTFPRLWLMPAYYIFGRREEISLLSANKLTGAEAS